LTDERARGCGRPAFLKEVRVRLSSLAASLAVVGVLSVGTVGIALTEPRTQPEQAGEAGSVAEKPVPPTARPRVERDLLATAVVNREPTKAPFPIPPQVGRLYYFTEVVDVGSPKTLLHIWYWRNRYITSVLLKVRGTRYRTWSYKTIPPTWTGEWRVEARTPDGKVLSSKTFIVETLKGTDEEGATPGR
jgi:hypothetical protein